MSAYRILVTISRDWDDFETAANALLDAASGYDDVTVVHGASQMDWFMAGVAYMSGMDTEPHPADWDRYGKAAGSRRNAEMAAAGANVCLALVMPCSQPSCRKRGPHGSHGATGCAELAENAGIPVKRFRSRSAPMGGD